MEATKPLNTRKEPFAHRFLHFYRNWVMNLLIVLVIALYFVLRICYAIPDEINRYYQTLSESVKQATHYQQYQEDANQLYITMQDQDYLSGCNLAVKYIEEGRAPEDIIALLNDNSDAFYSVFYLWSDGSLISPADRDPLELTEAQLNQLIADGSLQPAGGTLRYFAVPCGEDCMIVRIDEAFAEQFSMDVLKFVSLDGFVFNDETLDIVSADEDTLPENLSQMYRSDPLENTAFTNPDLQVVLISSSPKGISRVSHLMLAVISPLSYQLEGYSICVYIPFTQILCNVLLNSGLPALLCMAFVFLLIFGSLHFRQTVFDENDGKAKIVQLPFRCYINLNLTRHITFMQLALGLLVIFCSATMLILGRFVTAHETAQYNLSQLVETEAACQETLENCWDVYTAPASAMAQAINILLAEGDLENNDIAKTRMRQLVDSSFLDEISVYDRNGENVFTTADHVGYPLTSNTDSVQYRFWDLMTGSVDHVMVRSDINSDQILYAVSRSDEIGVLVLTISDAGFGDLTEKLSANSVAANLNFCDSYLYMNQDSPEMLYRISDSGTVSYENKDFPVLSNLETFCGFRTINDTLYYVNGLGDETQSIFYLSTISDILEQVPQIVFSLIIFLLIACLLDFVGCAVYTSDSVCQAAAGVNAPHPVIGRLRRKVPLSKDSSDAMNTIWKQCLYRALLLIVFTLLLDCLFNDNSMLSFLLGSGWERGVSIFSLSIIVLAILAVFGITQAIKHFFHELTESLSPRASTACQMVYSVNNIVLIVWLLLFSATQVGIDATTILASLGISGLALGIAAKDTVNDMLNGIFIILDGRIQVGDYVDVGGFYGRIDHIGIRTTKIHSGNQEKSINNSDMKNVINYSRGTSSVSISFSVPVDTDLTHLSEVITDATPRFQEYCGGRLKGTVRLLDSTDFTPKSIGCCVVIPVDECDRKALTPSCNHVLREVLAENNITLA